jgi:hypothetical protein
MRPNSRLLLAAPLATFLSACPTGACDTSIVPSIIVEVRDSLTGAAAAAGAAGLAITGSYRITLDAYGVDAGGDLLSLATPGERAGNYTVRVTKPGYGVWEHVGVRIRERGCHTNQVVLTARLQPAI